MYRGMIEFCSYSLARLRERVRVRACRFLKNFEIERVSYAGNKLTSKPNFGFAYGVDRFAGSNSDVNIPSVRT